MKNYGCDGGTVTIPKRNLKFTKKNAASLVKVTYVDSFAIHGTKQWCRWSIKIDGKDCAVPITTRDTQPPAQTGISPHLPSWVRARALAQAITQ